MQSDGRPRSLAYSGRARAPGRYHSVTATSGPGGFRGGCAGRYRCCGCGRLRGGSGSRPGPLSGTWGGWLSLAPAGPCRWSAPALRCFWEVQGIQGVALPAQVQLSDQALSGLHLVIFIRVLDQQVTQDQVAVTRQGVEHLNGLAILEAVETAAQGLAVDGDDRPCRLGVTGQRPRMGTAGPLDRRGLQTLQSIADGGVGGGTFPVTTER